MRLIILFVCIRAMAFGQSVSGLPVSKYGLPVANDPAVYSRLVRENPDNKLLDLRELIPNAIFDVTYAGTNNFLGRKIYPSADVFLRKPAAEALVRVAARLRSQGLGLLLFDGYRPYSVTVTFYEEIGDTTFVADPRKGSKHNRGMAIDLSLFDLKTGIPLEMPSKYDEPSERAWHSWSGGDAKALANRQILKDAMISEGFEVFAYEWWHYDFQGWQSCVTYDLWHSVIRKANRKL